MTIKQIKLVKFILWICIFAVGIKMIYTYVSSQTIESYGLFAMSIFIASLLELYTFGKVTYLGGSREGQPRDEMEEHIVKVSSKISYFALMIIVLIIIVLDGNGKMINISLMLVFCATIVTLPFVQFLVAKKYR